MTRHPTRARPALRRLLPLVASLVLAAPAVARAQQPGASAAPASPAADTGRTLSLEEAMQLALRRSEVVRIAEAGVRRAEGQLLQARSQYLPQLNATAGYQRLLQSQFDAIGERAARDGRNAPAPDTTFMPQCSATPRDGGPVVTRACPPSDGGFGPIADIFASPNTFIFGLTGSQNLFTGGRVTAGYRAAQSGRTAAQIGLAAQQAQLRYDVAQAYFDTQLADRLRVIAESTYVQTERAFRQTQLARQVGNVSEFELLRARVTRDNVRPQVIQARTLRDVSLVRLRQLLDLPPSAPLRLSTDIESGVPQLEPVRFAADSGVRTDAGAAAGVRNAADARAALEVDVEALLAADSAVLASVDTLVAQSDTASGGRSVVRQAAENVEAQRQLLRAARGQRLPSVQLSTNYQRFNYPSGLVSTSLADFYPQWSVSLGVSVPIFTGGRIRGEEMVAQANLAEAREQLQQAQEVASLDARVAVAELQQAQASWVASLGTAEQAARAYTIADVRYREGISAQLELSDSRVQLQQALAGRAQAARNLQVARMRLALLRDLPFQQPAGTAPTQGAPGGGMQQQPSRGPARGAQQAAGPGGTQGSPTTGTFQ